MAMSRRQRRSSRTAAAARLAVSLMLNVVVPQGPTNQ
jgi:hypothetical protein